MISILPNDFASCSGFGQISEWWDDENQHEAFWDVGAAETSSCVFVTQFNFS